MSEATKPRVVQHPAPREPRTEVARIEHAPAHLGYAEIERLGADIAASGLFGIKTKAQAVTLMMIAQAEGAGLRRGRASGSLDRPQRPVRDENAGASPGPDDDRPGRGPSSCVSRA